VPNFGDIVARECLGFVYKCLHFIDNGRRGTYNQSPKLLILEPVSAK
jgi:hypothetical protein